LTERHDLGDGVGADPFPQERRAADDAAKEVPNAESMPTPRPVWPSRMERTLAEWDVTPASVAVGAHELLLLTDRLPSLHRSYAQHAALAEEIDLDRDGGKLALVAVRLGGERAGGWPSLVLALRYDPAGGSRGCGVALVPETGRLFVGRARARRVGRLGPQALVHVRGAAVGLPGGRRRDRTGRDGRRDPFPRPPRTRTDRASVTEFQSRA
jgi:hypothetical protein